MRSPLLCLESILKPLNEWRAGARCRRLRSEGIGVFAERNWIRGCAPRYNLPPSRAAQRNPLSKGDFDARTVSVRNIKRSQAQERVGRMAVAMVRGWAAEFGQCGYS